MSPFFLYLIISIYWNLQTLWELLVGRCRDWKLSLCLSFSHIVSFFLALLSLVRLAHQQLCSSECTWNDFAHLCWNCLSYSIALWGGVAGLWGACSALPVQGEPGRSCQRTALCGPWAGRQLWQSHLQQPGADLSSLRHRHVCCPVTKHPLLTSVPELLVLVSWESWDLLCFEGWILVCCVIAGLFSMQNSWMNITSRRDHAILYRLCCCCSSLSRSLCNSITCSSQGSPSLIQGPPVSLGATHNFLLLKFCYGGSFSLKNCKKKKITKHHKCNNTTFFLKVLTSY